MVVAVRPDLSLEVTKGTSVNTKYLPGYLMNADCMIFNHTVLLHRVQEYQHMVNDWRNRAVGTELKQLHVATVTCKCQLDSNWSTPLALSNAEKKSLTACLDMNILSQLDNMS